MWLYFNKNGQLITSLEHGSPARVGTTDFSIFAVFEGINDETALEAIEGATIKLRKPDLMSTEYPTLLMDMASSTFILKNGETGTSIFPFVPNQKYYGFLFDFGNFNTTQQEEILLDTDGLWEATITLIKNNYNVQGVATFNVGGTGTPDPTNVSYDIVTNQLMQAIGRRALKSQVIIEIPDTSADISGYEEGQLFFCHEDKKLYIASLNEEAQEPFLEPELFWEYQEKLVSTVNIKTINHKSILGSGNITIEGGGGSGESIYDIYGMFISAEDARNIFEGNYNIIEWTVTENIDGSDFYHGFQLDAGVYRLRYSRYNILSGAKTYQLALPLGQLVEIVFTHEVNEQQEDIYDLEFIDMSNSSVAATQATSTIIIDPLHNLNGRYLSRYNAELIDMGGYSAYKITYLGEPLSKVEAKRYMTAMTGSSFVPMYNQYRPQNSLFVMANGTFWKPQFDFSNGLLLYAIPNPYELATRKVSSWQMVPDNTHYPSEKLVYDNFQNVREVAEGKCHSFVLSDKIIRLDSGYIYYYNDSNVETRMELFHLTAFYVYEDGEWVDHKQDAIDGEYDSRTLINTSFNSQNDIASISTESYIIFGSFGSALTHGATLYIMNVNGSTYPSGVSKFPLKKGDIFLVIETDVPDRWYNDSEYLSSFYKLETAKVDLSGYVDLTSNQTITGVKTIKSSLNFADSTNSSNIINSIKTDEYGGFAFQKSGTTAFSIGGSDIRFFSRDILPSNGNNNYSLGSSVATWKDLYLSGKAYFNNNYIYEDSNVFKIFINTSDRFELTQNTLRPVYSGNLHLGSSSKRIGDIYLNGSTFFSNGSVSTDWEVFQTNYGQLELKKGSAHILEIKADNISPYANATIDLGSEVPFRNAYLSGGANIRAASATANYKICSDNGYYLNFVFTRDGETSEGSALTILYGSKLSTKSIMPQEDGTYDLGEAGQYQNRWRDLYLSGNISDGTNSYSVVESMAQFNPTDTGSTTIKWSQMLTFSVSSTTGFTFETAKTGCMPEYKAIITNSHATDTVSLSFSGVQHILCNDDNIITTSSTIELPAGVTIEISCVNNNLIAVNFGA